VCFMANDLGINLGRVFELSFNIGILTYFGQNDFQYSYGDIYKNPLSRLYLREIKKAISSA